MFRSGKHARSRTGNIYRRPALAFLTAFMLLTATVALADNLDSDGDGLTPVADSIISFGTVCTGAVVDQDVLHVIRRTGTVNNQVFANNATVAVSVLGASSTSLVAVMGGDTQIVLPAGWTTSANNTTSSDTASSNIEFTAPGVPGFFSGTVGYRASGSGATVATVARTDTMTVTATVEECAPVDATAPVISYVLDPASPDGSNGWYTSDVSLTWTVTEDESPDSLAKTGCVDQVITADQLETTYSCSATSTGGTAAQVDVKIKRDATGPTDIAFVGGGVSAGGSYYFGSVPPGPDATCTADGAISGLASCAVTGGGSTVGTHSYTATATDNAGNSATAELSYTVLRWTLNGFYQPVDMPPTWNTVKGGSTVPFKFNIFAGATELTATTSVTGFTATAVLCPSASVLGDDIEVLATGGTTLRYDATGGHFIYNWQTPKKPGSCYQITMTTQDGSTLVAYFKLK